MRNAVLASLFICCATGAMADGVSDANAGMDALNSGDFATAVKVFTQAIDSGILSSSDLESAYVSVETHTFKKDILTWLGPTPIKR